MKIIDKHTLIKEAVIKGYLRSLEDVENLIELNLKNHKGGKMKDKTKVDTVTRMFEEMGVKVVDVTPKKKFVSISNPKDTKSGVSIQPKVDNKWEKDIREWNCKHTPGEYGSGCQCQVNYIRDLITQTQQETLEWVLKEVVGEDIEPDSEWDHGQNRLKVLMRQTIKKRINSLEEKK